MIFPPQFYLLSHLCSEGTPSGCTPLKGRGMNPRHIRLRMIGKSGSHCIRAHPQSQHATHTITIPNLKIHKRSFFVCTIYLYVYVRVYVMFWCIVPSRDYFRLSRSRGCYRAPAEDSNRHMSAKVKT